MPSEPISNSRMSLLRPEKVYRQVELVFDTNVDAYLKLISDSVRAIFKDNGFKHATLVVDIRNPSKGPMFK